VRWDEWEEGAGDAAFFFPWPETGGFPGFGWRGARGQALAKPALGRRRTPTPGHYEPGARSLQPECAAWLPASAGRRPEKHRSGAPKGVRLSKRKARRGCKAVAL